MPYLTAYFSSCFPSFSVSKYIFLPPGRLNAHFCPSACAIHSSVYRGSPHSVTSSVILITFRGNCTTPPPSQLRPFCHLIVELRCLKQCCRILVALYLIGLMLVLTAALSPFSPPPEVNRSHLQYVLPAVLLLPPASII